MESWLRVGHIVGVLLWVSGLSTVYWLLRFHAQAPTQVHDKLVLMERSLALSMDLAAALAMGCGLGLAFYMSPNAFVRPGGGWFHLKLTIVVLGILTTHGMIRARVAKFSRGETPAVPQWLWTVLLISIVSIVILVFRGYILFAKA